MEKALGLDLAKTTSSLFIDAGAAFAAKGAEVSTDATVAPNPVLVAKKGTVEIRAPRNKNYVFVNGVKTMTDGVTVYIADTKKWYLGAKAVGLLK